jgi:hypothetical protein
MALIVEDGTIVAGAESYITVADATAYFAARGNTAWSGLASDTLREQALRKGTDYMEATYGLRWKGDRVSELQALSWPRSGAYANGFLIDSDAVPLPVRFACAELAVRASTADLLSDPGAQVKSETVGPISVTYQDGARQQTRYEAIDRMLAPYLSGNGQVAVVRA